MKLLGVFRKTIQEQRRDLLALSLTLVFAPAMVFLYWLWFPSGSTTYGVLVLNQDSPVQVSGGAVLNGGDQVIQALQSLKYANGNPLLKVSLVTGRAEAEIRLREREAAVLLVIPEGFTPALLAVRDGKATSPAPVVFAGDLTNPYYAVAATLANASLGQVIQSITNQLQPVQIIEEPLGASAARSEFEVYVPGLLVFAVILLVFLASMTVAREVESGTLRRLQITGMTALDFLGGTSAALVLVGVISVSLTFLVAWLLGFQSQGPLWLAVVIGAVASLSTIGVGLIIACFSRTVTQAFLIANFPLALFMFFSGAIYPVPRIALFTLAGRSFGLYDILPPTHAVSALNKVLTMGSGPAGVAYELSALLALSLLYFFVGVWLFKRRYLKTY